MAVRIKTRFRKSGPKTVEDRASVVAVAVWKAAHEAFRRMGKENFNFASPQQVTGFVTEFIAFLVQIADRIVYRQISEEDRAAFVNALARHLARSIQESEAELRGPGDYAKPFFETLNARFADYAECDYGPTGPGYAFVRYLGERVAEIMNAADNKWVLEYVMEIEAPEAVKIVKKAVGEVMGVKVG
jgi:hypothetical protein